MPNTPELTPTEFHQRWEQPDNDLTLLDVREPAELGLAALPQAVHIPMGELPGRLQELNRDRTIVVMCHSGGRSKRAAQFLSESGFRRVFNLAGGIDAWSLEVDSDVPRY